MAFKSQTLKRVLILESILLCALPSVLQIRAVGRPLSYDCGSTASTCRASRIRVHSPCSRCILVLRSRCHQPMQRSEEGPQQKCRKNNPGQRLILYLFPKLSHRPSFPGATNTVRIMLFTTSNTLPYFALIPS